MCVRSICTSAPTKTGSTFLQDLLWSYRDDVAWQGYHHPCAHANEMWLATNDVQNGAFVNNEMPQASGVWARHTATPAHDARRHVVSQAW